MKTGKADGVVDGVLVGIWEISFTGENDGTSVEVDEGNEEGMFVGVSDLVIVG